MSVAQKILDLSLRVATEIKANKTLLNGNAAGLSALTTTAKGNLVAAINELHAALSTAALIDDATTVTTKTWSSQKIADQIAAALNALTTGAPTALDTLDELSAALGDDTNFAGTVTTALGNRVRVDANQTLTAPQQATARTNIAAASATDVGDIASADPVATFNTGLI
jgi:hypothetical protein